MELILGIFLQGSLSDRHELGIEGLIHDREDKEIEQTDDEQRGREEQRGIDRVHAIDRKLLTDHRREPHSAEDSETGNRHLQAHSERHFLALEPFRKDLTNRRTGHLTAAAEDHEAEHRQFRRTGHGRPPGIEPFYSIGIRPGDTPELDGCADHHKGCGEQAGETDSHLIEDDTCDDEETENVKQELTCRISTEHALIPSQRVVEEGSQRREDVHKHICEEHHRSHEDQDCPTRHSAIAKCLLEFFYHNCRNKIFSFLTIPPFSSRTRRSGILNSHQP